MSNIAWSTIFDKLNLHKHNFANQPYYISALQIKDSTKYLEKTSDKEVRLICKQDTLQDRPDIFKENNLFILPVQNGKYAIIQGNGYVNIPNPTQQPINYISKLDFVLQTSTVGNSEMQHLDYAYANSLIKTFTQDDTLILTIRGRKYTPEFDFYVNNHYIKVKSVQTEVDAGYEGKNKLVLVEAKNSNTNNTIIRQLYYPYKQWQQYTKKEIQLVFFEKRNNIFNLWLYKFNNPQDYNSIALQKQESFIIKNTIV